MRPGVIGCDHLGSAEIVTRAIFGSCACFDEIRGNLVGPSLVLPRDRTLDLPRSSSYGVTATFNLTILHQLSEEIATQLVYVKPCWRHKSALMSVSDGFLDFEETAKKVS